MIHPRQRVEEALEADRRARPPAHPLAARPLEVAGEDRHPVRQAQQAIQAAVLGDGVAAAEIGAADIADEQRIAGQHHRGFGAARRIDDEDRDQLRAMAGGVQHPQAHLPQFQLLAVLEGRKG